MASAPASSSPCDLPLVPVSSKATAKLMPAGSPLPLLLLWARPLLSGLVSLTGTPLVPAFAMATALVPVFPSASALLQ